MFGSSPSSIARRLIAPALLAALGSTASAANPVVVMETSMGKVTIELYPDKAPKTVENFLGYTDHKYYDKTVFHRVIPGFMIQGGGMIADLSEKPTAAPIKNESGNGLSNTRGMVAMARKPDPDSATAQFYINLDSNDRLDNAGGGYTVFGKVIEGMDVVDKIARVETGNQLAPNGQPFQDVPKDAVTIKSIRRR